jgi:hypothetical protein
MLLYLFSLVFKKACLDFLRVFTIIPCHPACSLLGLGSFGKKSVSTARLLACTRNRFCSDLSYWRRRRVS